MRLELKANIAHKLRGSALADRGGAGRPRCRGDRGDGALGGGGDVPDEERTSGLAAIAALQAAVAEAIAQIERLRR